MTVTLPSEFADLQGFVSTWALATEYERSKVRRASQPQELNAFYDKMMVRMPAVLKALDEYPLGQLPATHRPLMHLALSLGEIAPNVEFYRLSPDVPNAFNEDHFLSNHGNLTD